MASKGQRKARKQPVRRPSARPPRFPKFDPTAKPIWEIAEELAATVPESEWARVPRDLSKNLHHYLHGAPKEEDE